MKSLRHLFFTVVLAILFLIPLSVILFRLWGGGFTGGDEGSTAVAAFLSGNIWQAGFDFARGQGRFYQVIIYPIAQIPYLLDSLAWTNFWRISSSGLAIIAFLFFVSNVFGIWIGYLSAFIYLGLSQTIGGGYNPFHSLPLWFNLGIACIFLSYGTFARSLKKSANHFGTTPLLFFAFSLLTYEAMIFYIFGFPCIYLYLSKDLINQSPKKILKLLWNISLKRPVILLAAYLICYIIFKWLFPSNYLGTVISLAPINEMAQAINVLSWSGTQLEISSLLSNEIIRTYLPASALVVALTGVGVFIILVALINGYLRMPNQLSLQRQIITLALVALFIFFPNVLFGLTERYRQLALHSNVNFYIGSYYSAFSIALFFALLVRLIIYFILSINKIIGFWTSLVSTGLFTCVAMTYFIFVSYENQVASEQFFNLSKAESVRWNYMNRLTQYLKANNIKIQTFCTHSLIEQPDPNKYWDAYLSKKLDAKSQLVFMNDKDAICDAYIFYHRYDFGFRLKGEDVNSFSIKP